MKFDKEQEIWYAFNEKNETLNIEEAKKYVGQNK
jgi:hypothetical protein